MTKVIHTRDKLFFFTVQGPTNPSTTKRMLVGTLRPMPKPTGVKGSPGTKLKQLTKKYSSGRKLFFKTDWLIFGRWLDPRLEIIIPQGGMIGKAPRLFLVPSRENIQT